MTHPDGRADVVRFKVGQVWTDGNGRTRQKIVAITDNPNCPIITQEDDGTSWEYDAQGSWPALKDSEFSLTTLIRDVPDQSPSLDDEGYDTIPLSEAPDLHNGMGKRA